MGEIEIIAETRLKPGEREKIMHLLGKLVECSRSEAGNITYNVLEDLENPDHLVFVEKWATLAAIEEHNASLHFKEFAKAMEGRRLENKVIRLKKLF